jgi:hypothetical protein
MANEDREAALRIEAHRQLASCDTRLDQAFARTTAAWAIDFYPPRGEWELMMLSLSGPAHSLATSAAAHLRLDGDVQRARSQFGRWAPERLPVLRALVEAIDAGTCWPNSSQPLRLACGHLLFPLHCVLLAGDPFARRAFGELATLARVENPADQRKVERADVILVRQVLQLLAGRGDDIGDDDYAAAGLTARHFSRWYAHGHYRLPALIARRDAAGLAQALADCDAGIRRRRKLAAAGLDAFGTGGLARVAGIDVLGTSLCRLAWLAGLDPGVDNDVHPAALFRD